MANAEEVLRALYILIDELGPEFDQIVDHKKFLKIRAVLDYCRHYYEHHISELYLPQFRFENEYHAYWFIKTRTQWLHQFTNYPMKPELWDEHWLRSIMVPKKQHYVAEVAHALQAYDQRTARTMREFEKIRKSGDQPRIARAAKMIQISRSVGGLPPGPVKGEQDLMAMRSWPNRILKRFREFKLPGRDRSIFRLASNAAKYREKRENDSPPSRWRIVHATYIGHIENPTVEDKEKWDEYTEGYLEQWEWAPCDDAQAPSKTKITFREPASPELWKPLWNKNRPAFIE